MYGLIKGTLKATGPFYRMTRNTIQNQANHLEYMGSKSRPPFTASFDPTRRFSTSKYLPHKELNNTKENTINETLSETATFKNGNISKEKLKKICSEITGAHSIFKTDQSNKSHLKKLLKYFTYWNRFHIKEIPKEVVEKSLIDCDYDYHLLNLIENWLENEKESIDRKQTYNDLYKTINEFEAKYNSIDKTSIDAELIYQIQKELEYAIRNAPRHNYQLLENSQTIPELIIILKEKLKASEQQGQKVYDYRSLSSIKEKNSK